MSSGLEPVVAHGLVRTFGPRRVLDGLDLTVAPGTRLGLIGENGTGKSTLLRLLAGRDVPDEGTVQVVRDLVYLPQEPEPAPHQTVGATVSVRGLRVAGRLRLDRLDVGVGEKVLVTGVNGSGKSTLLDVLAGRLLPDEGAVRVAARTVTLVGQDPVFDRPDLSARATYAEAVGAETAETVPLRSLGLLHPRDHETAAGALSVGQRRRLSIAVAVAAGPDLLLLDEPTNHVSLRLAGELEEALGSAPGTVVVTSHDRWLRSRWSGTSFSLAVRGSV